ncbi:hypothetical protein LX36DRAFT_675746 [Colletotrichum falcatum]|nr:hypothetical protein LX36DRAFT_675746 [Colletotrichum falcatum]
MPVRFDDLEALSKSSLLLLFFAGTGVYSRNALEDGELDELPSQPSSPSKQDVPFTDSGYASGLGVDHLLLTKLRDANTSCYVKYDREAKTVYYSGSSTVAIDQSQRFIADLSTTIYGRVSGIIGADNWQSLSRCLSGLIKDFAIKLGLESSAQLNRDTMYFIQKRSRYNADESKKAKRDHMPLRDKMALWISKDTEIETSVNASERFVGVTDAEETIDTPELHIRVQQDRYGKQLIQMAYRKSTKRIDPRARFR